MNTLKPFLYLLLFVLGIASVKAQRRYEKVTIKMVSLDTAKNGIRFKYKINAIKRKRYRINLYYSQNNGYSFRGPLKHFDKDTSFVTSKKDHCFTWFYGKDNPYFDGKNTIYRIEAIEMPGDSRNTWVSLFAPGLGHAWVDAKGKPKLWVTGILLVTVVGSTGLYAHGRCLFKRHKNLNAGDPLSHQNLYDQGKKIDQYAKIGFGLSGALWLANLLWVRAKGQRNQRKYRQKSQKTSSDKGISTLFKSTPSPYFTWASGVDPRLGNGQISLLYKF